MTDNRSCNNSTNNDVSFHSCRSGGEVLPTLPPTTTSPRDSQQEQLPRSIQSMRSSVSSTNHSEDTNGVLRSAEEGFSFGSHTNTSRIRELLAANEASRAQSQHRDGNMLLSALAFTPVAIVCGLLCTFRLCDLLKVVVSEDNLMEPNNDLELKLGLFTSKSPIDATCVRYSNEQEELLFDGFFIAARCIASIASVMMAFLILFYWCTCCGICCFQRIRQYYICLGMMFICWSIINCFSLLLLLKSNVCDHIQKSIFLEELDKDLTTTTTNNRHLVVFEAEDDLEVETSCSLGWTAWLPIIISAIYFLIGFIFLWIGCSRSYVQSLVEEEELLAALLIMLELHNRLPEGEELPFDFGQLVIMLRHREFFEALATWMESENNHSEEELQAVAAACLEATEENRFAAAAA